MYKVESFYRRRARQESYQQKKRIIPGKAVFPEREKQEASSCRLSQLSSGAREGAHVVRSLALMEKFLTGWLRLHSPGEVDAAVRLGIKLGFGNLV